MSCLISELVRKSRGNGKARICAYLRVKGMHKELVFTSRTFTDIKHWFLHVTRLRRKAKSRACLL